MKKYKFYFGKIGLLVIITLITIVNVIAQDHESKDNYTGNWEDAGTWDIGDGNINNGDIIDIKGHVNRNSDLLINNLAVLNVIDTLIIYGNFTVGNNGNLNILSGGILIVYGNATMDNRVDVALDSYFVVFGNYDQGNNSTIDAPDNDTLLYVSGTSSCGGGGTICLDADLVGDEDDMFDNPDLDEIIEATSNFITPRAPTFCIGGSVVLSIRDDGSNYQWSFEGSDISGATSYTYTATQEGEYDVDFYVGGVQQLVVPVTVTSSGTTATHTVSGIVTNETAIDAGDGEIDITVTGATDPIYDWSNGETTEDLTLLSAGDYTVEVEDVNGCRVSETFSVGVGGCTDPSLSTVTTPEICNGSSYDLNNVLVVDANGTSPTYTYHSGTPALPGNELVSTTVSPTTTTTYYILGTNGSCTDELAVVVTVNALPVFVPTADSPICFGETSQLKANFNDGSTTYSWSPSGDLTFPDTQENPVFDPSITGTNPTIPVQVTVTFSVTVTDSNTCSDAETVAVVVTRNPETGPDYHIDNTWGN